MHSSHSAWWLLCHTSIATNCTAGTSVFNVWFYYEHKIKQKYQWQNASSYGCKWLRVIFLLRYHQTKSWSGKALQRHRRRAFRCEGSGQSGLPLIHHFAHVGKVACRLIHTLCSRKFLLVHNISKTITMAIVFYPFTYSASLWQWQKSCINRTLHMSGFPYKRIIIPSTESSVLSTIRPSWHPTSAQ